MTVSELIEQLKEAPAGSKVKAVSYLSDDDIKQFEKTDDNDYRIYLDVTDINTECCSSCDPVTIYL